MIFLLFPPNQCGLHLWIFFPFFLLSLTICHPSFSLPISLPCSPFHLCFYFFVLRFFSPPLVRRSPFLLLMKCEKWSSVGWSGQKFAGLMAWQNESRPSSPSITALRRLQWGSVKVLAYWLPGCSYKVSDSVLATRLERRGGLGNGGRRWVESGKGTQAHATLQKKKKKSSFDRF